MRRALASARSGSATAGASGSKASKLTIHTLFGSAAMKKSHIGAGFEAGTNSGLDQLEELVAGLQEKTAR